MVVVVKHLFVCFEDDLVILHIVELVVSGNRKSVSMRKVKTIARLTQE